MLCKRCLLPEHKPDIWLNENGICNICIDFDKRETSQQSNKLLESELVKALNKYRGGGRYDCLVMCSGGKDSTSSLYYMKKRYKLNPLAFSFDNGFESKEALENVKNAIKILGVDWLYFKSDFMKEMYAEVIKTKSKVPMCPLCSLWYMQLTYEIATQYNLPLIIAGWTRGQLTKRLASADANCNLQQEFILLCRAIPDFIDMVRKKYPKYKNFPKTMNEVKKKYKISKKVMISSPHWFLQDTPEEYTELIKKELHWKPMEFSYPADSTNCYLNIPGSYLSMKYYGFTHFHVEMSKLIRLGEVSREEALKKLELNINNEPATSIVASVFKKLGLRKEDL